MGTLNLWWSLFLEGITFSFSLLLGDLIGILDIFEFEIGDFVKVNSGRFVVASRMEVTKSSSMLAVCSCSLLALCSKCFVRKAFRSVAHLVWDIFVLRICLKSFLSSFVKVVLSVCSSTRMGSIFSGLTMFKPKLGLVSVGITVELSNDPNLGRSKEKKLKLVLLLQYHIRVDK